MSDIIIKAENVGKSYLIGHQRQQGYTALRDVVSHKIKGAAKNIKNTITGKQLIDGQEIEEFWALKDVSFEIKQGDAVGIIGRNGAGKSTLLKVLSRITEPTTGRITLNGRVASLLEVGTGFHPELSGRENIYLNGAILGMSRAEIKKKFDEIVDFSGVEKFLDTPVKRYSSGMYVRLAFSVAAHLEPEILVVDEVLAVGDAEFQKKCLGKMDDVCRSGRTVLFVSHDMSAISTLTNKAILLENGIMSLFANTAAVISRYSSSQSNTKSYEGVALPNIPTVTKIDLQTSELGVLQGSGSRMEVNFEITMPEDNMPNLALSFQILNHLNHAVIYKYVFDFETPICRKKGKNKMQFSFPNLRLYKGQYFVRVHLADTKTKNKYQTVDCCFFEVEMINMKEPEWGWQKNVCQYVEDGQWHFENS